MTATQGAMNFWQLRDEISWANLLLLITSAPSYKEYEEENKKTKKPVLPELKPNEIEAMFNRL